MEAAASEQMVEQFNGDFQTDFLSVEQLSLDDLNRIHEEADAAKWLAERKGEQPVLQGHLYDLVFWDSPSTRTKESFKHAIIRLGAKFVDFHQETSSKSKGESFEDTIDMLDSYLVAGRDGLIIRNKGEGKLAVAAEIAGAHVINAGDGTGEHPTQAVLDTKTIRERFPNLDETKVVFFGDLARARTVNSSAPLLAAMGIKQMAFVAPHHELRADPKLLEGLRLAGVETEETDELSGVSKEADVIYGVRTQYEFMEDPIEGRAKFTGKCLIRPEDMDGSDALLMHPLPEDEQDINLHPALRSDPRCIVREQAAWGQWTRMGILALQAGKSIQRSAEMHGIRVGKPRLSSV